MALSAVGFDGTVNEVEDAKRSQFQGSLFPVVGTRNTLAVSINSSATLTCNITSGVGWAHGLMVNATGTDSVTFDPVVTAGQTRWDAVCLRRDWANNTVSFVVVKGTAAANAQPVLPVVNDNPTSAPGVLFDQVLALVQITNGQSLPTAVQDRRLWGSKVFTVRDLAALPPANNALFGAESVLFDGSRYRCMPDESDSMAWIPTTSSITEQTGTSVFSASAVTGWSGASPMVIRGIKGPYWRQLDIELNRTGDDLNSDDVTGDAPNTALGTVLSGYRPDVDTNVPFSYRSGTAAASLGFGGTAVLTKAGALTLYTFNNPTKDLTKASTTSEVSLRISLHFGTRSL